MINAKCLEKFLRDILNRTIDGQQPLQVGAIQYYAQSFTDEQLEEMQEGLRVEPDGQTPLAGAAIRGLELIQF